VAPAAYRPRVRAQGACAARRPARQRATRPTNTARQRATCADRAD